MDLQMLKNANPSLKQLQQNVKSSSATTYFWYDFDKSASQYNAKGWVPASGLQTDQVKKKKRAKTNIRSFIGMEKRLSILAIVKSQGVPPSSVKLCPFLYPLHGKGPDGRAGTGAGSAILRSLLTLKDQIRCHRYRSTSIKSLYKDVRTLDLQVLPASGVKEENFPLLIPSLENTKGVFITPVSP